jgi:hypothetical protein
MVVKANDSFNSAVGSLDRQSGGFSRHKGGILD